MANKIIYFDMDGTLADLYSVDSVFKKLDTFNVSPYVEAKPINKYIDMLKEYKNNGYKIIILSCLSKITNDDYDRQVVNAKGIWLDKYVGREYIDERIFIPYTKDKSTYVYKKGTLIDDDINVCNNWSMGKTIVANK